MSDEPAPPRWLRPLLVVFVGAVAAHALFDGRGRAVHAGAVGVAGAYVVLDWLLRKRLSDAMATKRVLQIVSAIALSVTTTASLLDGRTRAALLTTWTTMIALSLAIEIGVMAASLITAVRAQLAMPALLLHHGLLLLACDYVARSRFGTGVIIASMFQETTNVGWYLHWVLNSPESKYHERWPRLFNLNALWTIGWYAVGRFGIATPILLYALWKTPPDAPRAYLGLFVIGLAVQTIMNVQNFVKLVRSYPRCPSSWLHRPASPIVPASARADHA